MRFKNFFFLLPIWLSFLVPLTAQESITLKHSAPISALAFSPVDAALIASANEGPDTTIKLWNLQNDTLKHLGGHTDTVTDLAFSLDGRLLASSGGGRIFLWDVPRLQRIAFFRHNGPGIHFSPDGQLLATSGRHVTLFDVNKRTEIATLEHDEWVWVLDFSRDGKYLATDDHVGTIVKVWDIQQKQVIETLEGHTKDVNFVKFSPADQILASSAWGEGINLWDVSNWERLGTLPSHAAALDFSPDGKTLASAGWEEITLWSVETGEPIATLPGHAEGWIREIAFSPNGTTLASGGADGIVRIQNINFHSESKQQQDMVQHTVRLIYLLPNDRLPQTDIDAKMDRLIKDVQQVYAQQMESQGFSRKTFTFETDADGNAVVHHVKGKFNDAHYQESSSVWENVWGEVEEQFDRSKNIYLIALDVSSEIVGDPDGNWCGIGSGETHSGGAIIPASGGCFNIDVTAHELGHAFGLQHDFRSNATAKRILLYTSEPMSTSFCAAEWLDAHRYFNPQQTFFDEPTTIEMLPPVAAPPNAIRFRFKVSDADGLHQVQFLTPEIDYTGSLLACKRIDESTSRTLEFVTTELTPKNESVFLQVMDVHGNFLMSEHFPIDITPLLPPSKVVSLRDANLAAAVRETLNLESDTPLTTHTLLNLIRLQAPNREITDLTGLEHAHNLKELNLGHKAWVNSNDLTNLAPLKELTNLITLDLSFNSVSDVSALAGLTHLTELSLNDNGISDVSALTKLKHLRNLNLSNNGISDVSALAGLTHLTELSLNDNGISDVSALARLAKLAKLYLWNNAISDVSALTELTALEVLHLFGNSVSDVSPLANLTNLTELHLEYNAILDISPLAELDERTTLYLIGNPVFGTPGPKIEGPWLWMIAPTGGGSGTSAAASEIDYLSRASGGTVTEQQIATHGATVGGTIGDRVWTSGKIAPTGGNNITDLMNAIGFGSGDINHHVAYGSITLESPRRQNTRMYVGSDDAVKIWLNGVLIHKALVKRGANDYQNFFPATLKRGKNVLFVAVYQGGGYWSGFFGFQNDTEYTVLSTDATGQASPAVDVLITAPKATALLPNYPNPFNPETWIPYHLATDAAVKLTIYDMNGRVVCVLDFGHQHAGIYQSRGRAAYWDGRNQTGESVASGLYFYTLTAGDFTATRKLLIAK